MENKHQDRDEKVAMILNYFGVIMAIFYFIMGASILFFSVFESLDAYIRYIFAALLINYGAFRLYRILKK